MVDDIIVEAKKGPRKTRRQRRREKLIGIPESKADTKDLAVNWEVPENMEALQRKDETLKH